MEIKLETRHFKEATNYDDSTKCPLRNALKELYPKKGIWVSTIQASINGVRYRIEGGEHQNYDNHRTMAYSGLSEFDVDALIIKAKAGEEIETVIVNLIPEEA